jgi:hypothetical protein
MCCLLGAPSHWRSAAVEGRLWNLDLLPLLVACVVEEGIGEGMSRFRALILFAFPNSERLKIAAAAAAFLASFLLRVAAVSSSCLFLDEFGSY